MFSVPSNRLKSVAIDGSVTVVSASTGSLPASAMAPDAPAPAATLRETMAAVVSAVDALERREGAGQKTVDLQFHVSGEHLALRVELRDGTVHTTFRTDSTELRSALAQEWRSVVPSEAGREMRLAEPVFHATPSSGGESPFGSLGQGTPHQRGQPAPEQNTFMFGRNYAEPEVPEAASVASATTSAPGAAPLLNALA